MFHLTVTLTTTPEGDRFEVHSPDPNDPTNIQDVTEQYDLVAMATDDGRNGWAVLKKASASIQDEAHRNMDGVEL
jgi:hypothetical protein